MNIEKAIELYKSGLGVWKISKMLQVPKSTLYENLIKRKVAFRKSKRDQVIILHKPLQKITKEVAELLAIHAGDGSLSIGRWSLTANSKNKEFIKRVVYLNKRVTGVVPNVNDRGSRIEIRTASKQVYNYFKNFYPVGKKSYIVKLPTVLIKSDDKTIQKSILIGLFSTDGCFSFKKIKKLSPRIEFRVKSKKLRDQFVNLAKNFGFIFKANTQKHHTGVIHTAYIEKIDQVVKWMGQISSRCDLHNKRFHEWVNLRKQGSRSLVNRTSFRS